MQDDYYGHRNLESMEPDGRADEWIDWDFALASALQAINDYTDKYGLLKWKVDAEYIEISANKRIHKFQSAVDSATAGSDKKPYKPQPGEYFIPEFISRHSDKTKEPTFREWLEEAQKNPDLVD